MKKGKRTGKILRMVLALVLVGGLVGVILPSSALGKNQISYPIGKPSTNYAPSEILYFNREADFSDVQGYRNWYYMYNFDIPMSYGVNWWGDTTWHDPEGCCIITPNHMHPGCGGCDGETATAKWISPASGKVRIYGNVRKCNIGGGNGVTVGIHHNYIMLWSQSIAYDDDIGYDFDISFHIEEGDAVCFTVDSNCSNFYDGTSFSPTIILNTMPLAPGTECLEASTNTGIACFTTSDGTIEDLTAIATPSGAPAQFPHGMFTFKATGLSPGQNVTITVELPDPVPVGTKWWKYQSDSWYSLHIGDDDGDNLITFMLTDNGLGDGDDMLGQITDDGGPGNPGSVGWETCPINKMRVLLLWIALFAAILAGVSLVLRRCRRSQS